MNTFLRDLIEKHDLYDADLIVFQNGKIVVQEFVSNQNIPVVYQSHQLVRIASISKLFVAVAIMQLVEKGLLSLLSDVSSIVDFTVLNPHYPNHPITLKMLLTHTSSLQDTNQLYIPYNEHMRELFEPNGKYHSSDMFVQHQGQYVKPGERFVYYNTGFQLLAAVIETVSGKRFDQYISENILQPLGMISSFNSEDSSIADLIRPTYRKVSGEWTPQFLSGANPYGEYEDYVLGTNGSLFSPQGGLRSNAFELSKFMLWLFEPTTSVLSKQSLQEMMNIHFYNTSDYKTDEYAHTSGIGFHVIPPSSTDKLIQNMDHTLVGHVGIAYGFHGLFFIDPVNQNGVIFLTSGHGKPIEDYQGTYSTFFSFQEEVSTYINDVYWRKL